MEVNAVEMAVNGRRIECVVTNRSWDPDQCAFGFVYVTALTRPNGRKIQRPEMTRVLYAAVERGCHVTAVDQPYWRPADEDEFTAAVLALRETPWSSQFDNLAMDGPYPMDQFGRFYIPRTTESVGA